MKSGLLCVRSTAGPVVSDDICCACGALRSRHYPSEGGPLTCPARADGKVPFVVGHDIVDMDYENHCPVMQPRIEWCDPWKLRIPTFAVHLVRREGQGGHCRCNCGYRCGGPGKCNLDGFECLQQDDGKHFVRDCDHDWTGARWESGDGCISSVTCVRCGMPAIHHDARVGP